MTWQRWRWLVLVLLLVAGVWIGRGSVERIREVRTVDQICSAAAAGDWQRAIELGAAFDAEGERALRALECRCLALLETGDRTICGQQLAQALEADTGVDWLPSPELIAVAVHHLMDRGELEQASTLAQRANRELGDTPLLLMQELLVRSELEDEPRVLAEIDSRSAALGQEGNEIAFHLVGRYLLRQQWQQAVSILSRVRPRPDEVDTWFELDTELQAALGDAEALRRSFERWASAGGNPADLTARYALLVSVEGLLDPGATHEELLRRAVADDEQIRNRELAAAVRSRLIRYLAFLGRHEEAVQLYEESVREQGTVAGVTRDELLPSRAEQWEERHGSRGTAPRGTLLFRGGIESGDMLWVSPDPALAVDAPFEAYPVDHRRRVRVGRSLGEVPVRWVLRDAADAVVASGSIWPQPGQRLEIDIERSEPAGAAAWSMPRQPSGDGHRRVALLVLDGADWRLVRYLEARHEMPVLSELARKGVRGVLLSDPPFTAAALRAMVHPEEAAVSVPGLLFQMGEEVEALNFVGRNPLGFLEAVLPGREDLFEALGSGDLVLANLLRSTGAIQAGRHARVTGPGGAESELSGYRSARPLTEPELSRVRGLESDPERQNPLLEEIAADFDTAIAVLGETDIDLLALRVAALDILTHARYGPLLTSDQDDGDRSLLRIYSYIDSRLAELVGVLDTDDVLVVMSDHGIRNTLEHDPNCLFVAAAPGLEAGRLADRPAIQGTSRMIADLFGVDTGWPATGMESWVPRLEVDVLP